MRNTSWNSVGRWYDREVGEKGSHYHENVILPNLKRLMHFDEASKILDLGCGQGIFERMIPADAEYVGVDLSPELVKAAKRRCKSPKHRFVVADVTAPLPLAERDFTDAIMMLSLQNVSNGEKAILNAARHIAPYGRLLLVLNHPCFRVPRQSTWGIDESNKVRYRRVQRYMSSMDIPIQMQPSKGDKSVETWSYHNPISVYFDWLGKAGLAVTRLEEWVSDKESEGKAARMENLARDEIPLFMAILAKPVRSLVS